MSEEAVVARYTGLVQAALEREFPAAPAPGVPAALQEAMRYSLLAGGKRLRPVLCLGAAEAVGSDPERALGPACALECIHTYSLIHDDLPALDDDELRRGRPTNHKVFGEALALLAGDALLTLSFELVSRPIAGLDPARQLELVNVLAKAAGSAELIGGQVDDVLASGRVESLEALDHINRRKTGALFRAAVEMGAIVGGATAAQREALVSFAVQFGRAFQLTDDILDVVGDASVMGKTPGSDARKEKVTVPMLVGLEAARSLAADAASKAMKALEPLGDKAAALRWIVARLSTRTH